MTVRKTTITIDDEKLDRAKEILGTNGIRDTVDTALHEVYARELRDRHLRRLRTHEGLDLGDPDARRREAWRE